MDSNLERRDPKTEWLTARPRGCVRFLFYERPKTAEYYFTDVSFDVLTVFLMKVTVKLDALTIYILRRKCKSQPS